MTTNSRRRNRWTGLGLVTGAAVIGNGLRLRSRLAGFPVLGDPAAATPTGEPSASSNPSTSSPAASGAAPAIAVDPAGAPNPTPTPTSSSAQTGWVFLVADSVTIPDATKAAAIAHAQAEGLEVLDLIPADLPTTRMLDLARMVDPTTYRDAPLVPGRGAFSALCIRADVADRAQLEEGTNLSLRQMVDATVEAKRHSPRAMAHAVATDIKAAPYGPAVRAEIITAIFGSAVGLVQAVGLAQMGAMAAAAIKSPKVGAAAIAAWSAQPILATAGTKLAPNDRTARSAGRAVLDPAELAGVSKALAGPQAPQQSPGQQRKQDPQTRAEYDADKAAGVDRFFEERRTTCPWCDSADLTTVLDTDDTLQHKPGRFRLDRCGACGHRFQNPRLTIDGLDYYYRDFYDGIGAESADFVFGATDRSYVGRTELVMRHRDDAPKRWLDVGTGHGHFCLIAKGILADTTFDGLDMTDGIDEAARRGWVDAGHRGLFPELAPTLAGTYDVVSMHHYLEHTREPREELEAAATALADGGIVLIEVPNPDCVMGRVLRKWWVPWFQPQHQHLIPHANLIAALDELGFDLLQLEVAESHQPVDLTMATWFAMNAAGPEVGLPWLAPPTTADRVRRAATFAVGAPVLAASIALDNLIAPVLTRYDGGNTYRLVARKRSNA